MIVRTLLSGELSWTLGRRYADFSSGASIAAQGRGRLQSLLDGFIRSGARAVIVIPLFADVDENIYVVRLIAPASQRSQ